MNDQLHVFDRLMRQRSFITFIDIDIFWGKPHHIGDVLILENEKLNTSKI